MDGYQISFQFQIGLVRDRLVVDSASLNLKSLKSKASDFICEKFPQNGLNRLDERILLFKHDYKSTNILQMVNAVTDIQEDTLVEIVISAQQLGEEDIEIRPHSLSVHSYKTPTFCHFCGELLMGLFKQGLKCEGCGLNFHKRCVFKIPNDCSYKKKRRGSFVGSISSVSSLTPSSGTAANLSTVSSDGVFLMPPNARDGSVSPGTAKKERSTSMIAGRPPEVELMFANRMKIPHTFVIHTYTKPTQCQFCKKMLVGVFKQGVQCKDCRYNAHKKCSEKVPRDCTGEIALEDQLSISLALEKSSQGDSGEFDTPSSNGDDSDEDDKSPTEDEEAQDSPGPAVTPKEFDSDGRVASANMPNIPVQRVVQSVKQTKRVNPKTLKEGWLVHFTKKDSMPKRHYWRLDTKCITMYRNDTGTNYYKEIPLSEILAVDTAKKAATDGQHCFEVRTANVDYFVGQDVAKTSGTNSATAGSGATNKQTSGIGSVLAKEWETAIRKALTPTLAGAGPGAMPAHSSHRNPEQPEEATKQEKDISQAYQIFPDEVLGSGQFGIVYGGVHRTTGHVVAIKIIEKKRFPTKQEAALKNEVQILQNLHHPGVVNLERMFETPERIFVVMEKLKGDMLEMILSSELGRLSERITRFLVMQILVALKHLHSKNIVHCDLKPENVLLSSDSDFPQVKLCDFGFARIIGEKSFRKSVVGTPAYLAPEVLRNKGYNRSLDMWSTGVIIYVSLSGTFPFNEDEDINEQIQNAAFMYPPHPWKEIGSLAVDLIGNLLQVKSRKRHSVEKSLLHPWLDTYETWSDLRDLETKNGNSRWLTHESDEQRWEKYRKQHNTPAKLADLNDGVEKVRL